MRWHKRGEFAKLSAEAKNKLHTWQNTAEGKGVVNASMDVYFAGKGKNENGKSNKDKAGSKKLYSHVVSLQKQLNEQSQLSEIVAVLIEDSKAGTVSNTNAEEKSIFMARKAMKIVGGEKIRLVMTTTSRE